ncbi:MAG: hypothetical protein R2932_38085 [Caldilineaceae bacterium]
MMRSGPIAAQGRGNITAVIVVSHKDAHQFAKVGEGGAVVGMEIVNMEKSRAVGRELSMQGCGRHRWCGIQKVSIGFKDLVRRQQRRGNGAPHQLGGFARLALAPFPHQRNPRLRRQTIGVGCAAVNPGDRGALWLAVADRLPGGWVERV